MDQFIGYMAVWLAGSVLWALMHMLCIGVDGKGKITTLNIIVAALHLPGTIFFLAIFWFCASVGKWYKTSKFTEFLRREW